MHYRASMGMRGKAPRRKKRADDDSIPFDLCDGCRRTHGSTVAGLCYPCTLPILAQRRRSFPRSEGNVYMRKLFGRPFQHTFKVEVKPSA